MFLLKISENPGSLFFAAYFAGWLIAVLVVSFLSTPVLRLSADFVAKRMPRLRTAFFISFFSSAMFFIGAALAARYGQPRGGSVLSGGSSVAAFDSPLIHFLPLVFSFVSVWIFGAKHFTDGDLKSIGFTKGLIVAFIHTALMTILGTMLFFGFVYLTG